MFSKLINKYTRRKIYVTLIGPVVTYACETWTLSVQNMNNLFVFERQILRKIFEPVQCKESWRIRSNNELLKLIKGDYVKYIPAQRIKLWGSNTLFKEGKTKKLEPTCEGE
jgi:hypothetical protein